MAKMLWKPSEERITSSNMYRFMNLINARYGTHFTEYTSLYEWSVRNIADFWAAMWDFGEIKASRPYTQVVDDVTKMLEPDGSWAQSSILQRIFFGSATSR